MKCRAHRFDTVAPFACASRLAGLGIVILLLAACSAPYRKSAHQAHLLACSMRQKSPATPACPSASRSMSPP